MEYLNGVRRQHKQGPFGLRRTILRTEDPECGVLRCGTATHT
jgi:hypothetical protein